MELINLLFWFVKSPYLKQSLKKIYFKRERFHPHDDPQWFDNAAELEIVAKIIMKWIGYGTTILEVDQERYR